MDTWSSNSFNISRKTTKQTDDLPGAVVLTRSWELGYERMGKPYHMKIKTLVASSEFFSTH